MLLFRSLHNLYRFWSDPNSLNSQALKDYQETLGVFRNAWLSLGWKPTVWVHWVCAHSNFYVTSYRSLFDFSSIPTEKRHQTFKLDLKHAFEGWKFKNPSLTCRYLARVVNLDALDQGLRLLSLKEALPADQMFERNRAKKRKRE